MIFASGASNINTHSQHLTNVLVAGMVQQNSPLPIVVKCWEVHVVDKTDKHTTRSILTIAVNIS